MEQKASTVASENLDVLELNALIAKAAELNMMPQVARKVLDLVADENATAAQLAVLLEKDPNITTRILKIANSAFYGLRREIKTVQQAIVILGFKALRSMVVASSSKALHKRFGITEQLMWDHSVGTAIGAKLVAEGKPAAVGEAAFVGGLLHNVGKTIMNNECPKAYTEVMKKVYNEMRTPLIAEMEVFKYAHPEVGSRIAEKWGLPAELAKLIRYQSLQTVAAEEKVKLYEDEKLKISLACIEYATHLCRVLGIGFRDKKDPTILATLESTQILAIDGERSKALLEKLDAAFKKERSIFN